MIRIRVGVRVSSYHINRLFTFCGAEIDDVGLSFDRRRHLTPREQQPPPIVDVRQQRHVLHHFDTHIRTGIHRLFVLDFVAKDNQQTVDEGPFVRQRLGRVPAMKEEVADPNKFQSN